MTFDHIQAICWSITYIFLIIYCIKYKTHAIPLSSICLNFSWETLALGGSILYRSSLNVLAIHVSWFSLDLVMIVLFLFYETRIKENIKQKLVLLFSYVTFIICFLLLFLNGYMLLLSFFIDLIMAVDFFRYIIFKKFNYSKILYFIGIFKLLGDVFAWLYYKNNFGIMPIGIIVLVFNIVYIILVMIKKNDKPIATLKNILKSTRS